MGCREEVSRPSVQQRQNHESSSFCSRVYLWQTSHSLVSKICVSSSGGPGLAWVGFLGPFVTHTSSESCRSLIAAQRTVMCSCWEKYCLDPTPAKSCLRPCRVESRNGCCFQVLRYLWSPAKCRNSHGTLCLSTEIGNCRQNNWQKRTQRSSL